MSRRTILGTTILAACLAICVGAPSARAADYWVDQKTGGDDGAGTAEKPFKTLSKGVSVLQAGDTLTVKGGVYREVVPHRALRPYASSSFVRPAG